MRTPRLRLVNNDNSTRYDLLYGTLALYDWRWTTATSQPRMRSVSVPFGGRSVFENYSMMTETLDLASRIRCANTIRTEQTRLEQFLVEARRHNSDPVHDNAIWLEWSARNEPAKRTLIYGGSWQFLNQPRVTPLLEEQMELMRLVLQRHPFWESVDPDIISTDDLSCLAGQWSVSGTPGSEPARISQAVFSASAGATPTLDPITRVWCGIREEYKGLTYFTALWECENKDTVAGGMSHYYSADTIDVSSLGSPAAPAASNDWYANCDFSVTTTMANRVGIAVLDVAVEMGGDENDCKDFEGRYLVLGRMRATGKVGVQLRAGFGLSLATFQTEEIYIDDTNYPYWELFELGIIQFPPEGSWEGMLDNHLQAAGIGIWAEQLEGGAELDMDCLVLIPANHFVYVDQTDIGPDSGSPGVADGSLYVITKPNDTMASLLFGLPSGVPLQEQVAEPNLWYMPPNISQVILAAQHETHHDLNDTLDLDFTLYPRWLSYRDPSRDP